MKGSKTERRKDTQNNKLGDYSLPTNMSVVKVRELFSFSLIIHHNELLSRFVIRLQCKLESIRPNDPRQVDRGDRLLDIFFNFSRTRKQVLVKHLLEKQLRKSLLSVSRNSARSTSKNNLK